jgi:oligopeptide transport system substrate-binding protein
MKNEAFVVHQTVRKATPTHTDKTTPSLLLVLIQRLFVFSALLVSFVTQANWNNPYPTVEENDNILYSAFSARPKFLDPARSYDESEYQFLGQIYEPPLSYHYLHRPYRLQAQTLTAMPKIIHLDDQGKQIDGDADNVAFTEYHLSLQQGILYQPHPALAKDTNGNYRYHQLTEAETAKIKTLSYLEHTGTRELVAEDYVYQIKRLANPALHSPISHLMQEYIVGLKALHDTLKANPATDLRTHTISGVSANSPHELVIRIKGQYPQFIYWLAMPFFAPMPWEADVFYAQAGLAKNNINLHWYPIGTGAYMLTENNPNLRMVLEKNPNFREQTYPSDGEIGDKEKGLLDDAGKKIPFIDKAVFTLEKESIPYWNKFLQGYFDSSGISSDSFDSAVSISGNDDIQLTDDMVDKGIKLNTVVNSSIFYLGFNMLDPIVGGKSERARLLRQAVSIAVDYEEYISIFLNGRGIPGQGPIPPGIFGHIDGKEGINPYIYDWVDNKPKRKSIAYAKTLLEQANYAQGIDGETNKPLILYYESVDGGAGSKARLNWLRKQLDKIDIQLVIRSTDYNRFYDKMSTGAAQLFNWGWNADYPDPENFLALLYGPKSRVLYKGENAANYANDEFDALFKQMKTMSNSPERQTIINNMLEIVRRDSPWAFSYHPKTFSLQHGWYKNTKPFIMSNTGTIKYKRIDTQIRNAQRQAWNTPIVWPLLLIIICLIALIIPAVMAYRRHERSRAL